MNIPKQQLKYIYLLVLGCIVGMCAGCSHEINYYPNVSKPSPFAKKLHGKEKVCSAVWYANRYKR